MMSGEITNDLIFLVETENKELMMEKPVIQPLAVDTKEAARLCGISERHFIVLDQEGLLGPRAVRLKSSVRWVLSELREWLNAGCPNREKWDQRKAEDRSAA